MSTYNFDLQIGNKSISFDSPIRTVLNIQNKCIVMLLSTEGITNLHSTFKANEDRNVICFDLEGNVLWEISECPPLLPIHIIKPYSSIRIEEKSQKVIAYNQNGLEYEVNLDTGVLIDISGQRAW